MPDTVEAQKRLVLLGRAFSPAAPIAQRELFLGRFDQLESTCDAVNERGQHFVLYGERGVGKTSLANIISSALQNVVVAKVTCNRQEDFKNVWQKALAKIRFRKENEGLGFVPEKAVREIQLDLFLPNRTEIDSLDVQEVLEKVGENLLFIFDEFDSIHDEAFKASFADTIKTLSDNAPHVTVGIVGIADSVESLIGKHPSVERCLRQIAMPRMSDEELGLIIDKGTRMVELEIDPDVAGRIVAFSSGFPHYTHLLAKYAAKHCMIAGSERIDMDDFTKAIEDAIANANQSIRDAYQKAVTTSRSKSKFEDVVAACALAPVDEFGTFAIRDLEGPYYRVTGQVVTPQSLSYNLRKLTEADRGSVLKRIDAAKNIRYQFANPLMKVYVRMKLEMRGSHARPRLIDPPP